MQADGKVRHSADPARLATATLAAIQGGLVLTQTRRDPQQLRIALDAAYAYLRSCLPMSPSSTTFDPFLANARELNGCDRTNASTLSF